MKKFLSKVFKIPFLLKSIVCSSCAVFTVARAKSLFKKNSWLLNDTHLSHSNNLQWTVCLWNLALVGWFQTVHGQTAVDDYLEITQIFTRNRFQPLGGCLFVLSGTPAMQQLVCQMPMVLNRCWIWEDAWISDLQKTSGFLFLSIPYVGMKKNK